MGADISDIKESCPRYRGGGWPGTVKIKESTLSYNRAAQIPFGKRLWSIPGCDVCGDSFGKNAKADITLMDPWGIRKQNELGETLITVHSENGEKILQSCKSLNLEKKEYTEIQQALSLKDVWRKQVCESVLRKKTCNKRYYLAVKAESIQRKLLRSIIGHLPQLPIICYRIIAKLPDIRNLILK